MARGDQLTRQWKLIQILLASTRGKSVPELADALQCHPRTVYRDLEALQMAGFPLFTETEQGKSIWSLVDTVKHHFPIPLSMTELLALFFSRALLKTLKNTIYYDSLESFFQKIKATLPSEYVEHLDRIEGNFHVGSKPNKAYHSLQAIIDSINTAIVDRKTIKIRYYSMSRRKETRRKVVPYKLWYFEESFYLIGYCRMRCDVRIFAVDRIKRIDITNDLFTLPDDLNIEDVMNSSFGIFLGKPIRVKIYFSEDIAGYIKEKIWHQTQQITPQSDGSIIFEAEVAGIEEIKFWVLRWGAKAHVLKPLSLRETIANEVAAMGQRYSKERKTIQSG